MASNDFQPHELVSLQGKKFPVVGGRLRVAHDMGLQGLETTVVEYAYGEVATVQATATSKEGGRFQGTGTAHAGRDGLHKKNLLELAETRAVARALRFFGAGVEYTGAEEVSDVDEKEPEGPSQSQLKYLRDLVKKLETVTGEPVKLESPKTKGEAQALIKQLKSDLGES